MYIWPLRCHICDMITGKHIGEYIERKLKEQGRTKTWLAGRMHTSRQNLVNLFDKVELTPSRIQEIKTAVGDDHFFDDYFRENPELGDFVPSVKEMTAIYERVDRGPGYKITIQIDPDDFDLDAYNASLLELSEDLTERVANDLKKKLADKG